jgi:hypothetical protein
MLLAQMRLERLVPSQTQFNNIKHPPLRLAPRVPLRRNHREEKYSLVRNWVIVSAGYDPIETHRLVSERSPLQVLAPALDGSTSENTVTSTKRRFSSIDHPPLP